MMMPIRRTRRGGYTLIELLIASAIATLLMLALYSAFDLTVTQTEVGRERVANTDLARAVIGRLSGDLSSSLGLLPPQSGQQASGSGSGSGSSSDMGTGTGMATGMETPTAEGEATTTTSGSLLPFQCGVIGDYQQVTLFVSKIPRALLERSANAADPTIVLPPDLKRVTYYVVPGIGLCRQERAWITAPGTGDTAELDTSNAEAEVLAPEVSAATFEYLNGTGWDSAWDGNAGATDGSAITGPPRAIRVTLTFTLTDDRGLQTTKIVQQVFPVRAAIGNSTTSTSERP